MTKTKINQKENGTVKIFGRSVFQIKSIKNAYIIEMMGKHIFALTQHINHWNKCAKFSDFIKNRKLW